MNLVEPELARGMTNDELNVIFEDLISEFKKCSDIVYGFIVLPHNCTIGAEPGCIFIEVDDKSKSEKMMEEYIDMRYKGRQIKMTCLPEEVYLKNFAQISTLT